MKRALVSCFALVTLVSTAQVTHHFPHENASWGQFLGTGWIFAPGYNGFTYFYNASGYDTVNGQQYIHIDGNFGQDAYIREDSIGRIWYFHQWDSTEKLVYDFSASAGDTLMVWNSWEELSFTHEYFEVIVDSVDSVTLNNGEIRRRLYINSYDHSGGPTTWIEGLGGSWGLAYPVFAEVLDHDSWFTCFTQNDTVKWGDVCNVIIGIDEVTTVNCGAYPNPNNGNFIINYTHQGNEPIALTVTNPLGQTVHTQQLDATKSFEQIELNNVATGIYIVNIRSGNALHTMKVAIQH